MAGVNTASLIGGEATTYVRANHFSSGNTPLDANLAYTYNLFYWTAKPVKLFDWWMKNNSFFSLWNPIQMWDVKIDITTPLIYTGTQVVKRYYSSSSNVWAYPW